MLAGGCQPAADEARRYQLHGQILMIRPATREVLIKHGDIWNFMPGKTMPFKVRDERMLSGKAPGDLETAQLMVGANETWLATLEKTGTAPLDEPAAIPPASFVGPLQPGDEVPLPEYCPLMDRRFRDLQRAIRSDADPAIWSFATARREGVDRFAAPFGANVIPEPEGTSTHNLRAAVIDPRGRVVRVHDSNQWTSAQVLDDLEHSDTR
jgi:Cu/Ag efflux protein CusF